MIVPSDRAVQFTSRAAIASLPNLRLAVNDPVLVPLVQRLFPQASAVSLADYASLPDLAGQVDGAVWTLPQAGAWADAHPGWTAVAPLDIGSSLPFSYMMPPGADNLRAFVDQWLELKHDDPELWLDRGLSYAAMQAWPRAISDFDQALRLKPNDVDILVLRAAAWRNAGNPQRALDDAARALKIAPDHSEALLERGFASLARGDQRQASADFLAVLRLVPPDSIAARRAQAGLRGEQPGKRGEDVPAAPPRGKR